MQQDEVFEMNQGYDGRPERRSERRSRRNPRMRGPEDSAAAKDSLNREREIWEERKRAAEKRRELDVMGDAGVRPLKRVERKQETLAEEMQRNSQRHSDSRKTSRSAEAAGRQTAAGGDGFPHWQKDLESRKKRRRRRLITMIIAECFALVFIFGYGYVARRLNKIQRPTDFKIEEIKSNDLNQETVEKMKGYWTIAIFGVDARNNAITKGTNADVNMICNINRDTGEIKLVSVFRDTYLNTSESGSYNKLNQAYFVGGPEQAIQALNRNLDLNITDYMTFNWKAVADAINVLGGVDIELSKAEFYYINSFITETVKATGVGSHQLTHAGMNHLDGVQAVAYGRLRLMDTDFARTERQRKIIAQAFEKAKQADFQTLNRLIGTVFPQVSTSIWVDDLVSNAKNISKFHLGETSGFPQARGNVSMGKKGAVVVPQTLESNVVKLHEFLFGDTDYTPSQTVKNISAKIAADTGMYKEGNYVDKVGTGGGVIQAPKQTKPAETKEEESSTAETDENSSSSEVETDEDGNPIETDENGSLVSPPSETTEVETDENGNPIESEKHPTRPTEPETDANGRPITRPTRPTEPETDANGRPITRPTRPTEPETDESGRPLGTTGESTSRPDSSKPGQSTDASETDSATKPTAGNGGTSPTPGNPIKPTAGGNEGTSVPKPTAGADNGTSGPGNPVKPTAGSNPGNNGPDGSTGTSTIPTPPALENSGNGVVAGPGM